MNMRRVDAIPTIQGSRAAGVEGQNGIHAIQINPSRTLLATGARHSSDIAVYRLPTLDPLCIGENSHRDWVSLENSLKYIGKCCPYAETMNGKPMVSPWYIIFRRSQVRLKNIW